MEMPQTLEVTQDEIDKILEEGKAKRKSEPAPEPILGEPKKKAYNGWLLSDSFIKRSIAVFIHYSFAQSMFILLMMLVLFICGLVIFLAAGSSFENILPPELTQIIKLYTFDPNNPNDFNL